MGGLGKGVVSVSVEHSGSMERKSPFLPGQGTAGRGSVRNVVFISRKWPADSFTDPGADQGSSGRI